ncbi:MAG TPA: lytic transglycosylase domain-containing protein [Mycobacteriales bacterium]|nr:lytic transglycosylase domain-containing protein [Mycobacteriales bacterium]
MSTRPSRSVLAMIAAGAIFVLLVVATAIIATLHAGSEQAAAASSLGATPSATPTILTTPPAVAGVPPLSSLTPPDVVVSLPKAAAPRALQRLERRPGVKVVAAASRGRVRLAGRSLRVLGVPLASIRGFTPSLTAASTALWQSVARGEITINYADSRHYTRQLGATLVAHGTGRTKTLVRLGAFATLGVPGGQAMVSAAAGGALGLHPRRVLFIAAPKVGIDTLKTSVSRIFGPHARITVTRAAPVDQAVMSQYAATTIPSTYLTLYRQAATTCPGLPWTVLAGIGTVETGNGRDVHRSVAGAEGPMQFLPSTWATWGYDADGDGKADIHDPVDAIFSAARYLCAAGAGRGGQSLDDAIYAYNHAWWYVREVITIANEYA